MSYSSIVRITNNDEIINTTVNTNTQYEYNINNNNNNNNIDSITTEEYKEQQFINDYNYKKKQKEEKNNKYKKYNEKTYNLSSNNIDNTSNTETILYNPDFCVKPRHINIYNKKYCMKWLTYKIDDNYYHYDYCVKLFEQLMKWVKYNNFGLKTNERVLLGKFISLMYLLSNKKDYYYNK